MEGSPRWSPTLKEEAGMSRAVLGNPAPQQSLSDNNRTRGKPLPFLRRVFLSSALLEGFGLVV